jgi:hypothetical protein
MTDLRGAFDALYCASWFKLVSPPADTTNARAIAEAAANAAQCGWWGTGAAYWAMVLAVASLTAGVFAIYAATSTTDRWNDDAWAVALVAAFAGVLWPVTMFLVVPLGIGLPIFWLASTPIRVTRAIATAMERRRAQEDTRLQWQHEAELERIRAAAWHPGLHDQAPPSSVHRLFEDDDLARADSDA